MTKTLDDLSFWDYVILAPALIGLFLAGAIAAIAVLLAGKEAISESRRGMIR
jgi:hypothetical protein